MNLAHLLHQQACRRPNELALVWGERSWTWTDLDARVNSMAAALVSLGIGKGDRVLVQSRNCNQLFESMFVCFRLGAIWVPVNWRLAPREVAQIAAGCQPAAIICQDSFSEHATTARLAAPSIRFGIVIGQGDFDYTYDEVVHRHAHQIVTPADVNYSDACWLFHTSGTTGTPKAAVLTHGQMGFVITNHIADLMPGLSHRDASLVVAPLSHGAGVHQLVQVSRGAKTVLLAQDRFDPDEVWRLVERWRITNLFAVPTIVKHLVEHESVDQYDHSSLRHLVYAGAPMYREDQKRALKKLGPVLVQYFGLGEVTGNITVLPPELHSELDETALPIGSCGYERTAMQVGIFDLQGKEQPSGEIGEICVCGPAAFPGYYCNPTANQAAFRDGWFRTGDLGYLDEARYLYITGRVSDMYISGGSNVYPREIEEQLLCHPHVADVAVVGLPDPAWGEKGVAVVVRRPGGTCTQEELVDFLDGRIARYKIPKAIVFWGELPKSAYGKVSKRDLQRQLIHPPDG